MIYWIDAQLPPNLANWLNQTFKVEAYALRDLNLRDAEDEEIFQKARKPGIVIISKDSDFVEMVLPTALFIIVHHLPIFYGSL
jgi:predicted nuclease of predicted toxin-antitoxin system